LKKKENSIFLVLLSSITSRNSLSSSDIADVGKQLQVIVAR
jgi:hypothetical protein